MPDCHRDTINSPAPRRLEATQSTEESARDTRRSALSTWSVCAGACAGSEDAGPYTFLWPSFGAPPESILPAVQHYRISGARTHEREHVALEPEPASSQTDSAPANNVRTLRHQSTWGRLPPKHLGKRPTKEQKRPTIEAKETYYPARPILLNRTTLCMSA